MLDENFIEPIDTSGFYKKEEEINNMVYAHTFVENADYDLQRELKDTYEYPINGWYWFNTREDARIFFNLPPDPPEPNIYENNTLPQI